MTKRRSQESSESRWHLDKRVPIALIVTIAIQTGSIIWWAASVTARLERLEEKAAIVAPQDSRLTKVEVQLEVVKEGIIEIKRLIQQRLLSSPDQPAAR